MNLQVQGASDRNWGFGRRRDVMKQGVTLLLSLTEAREATDDMSTGKTSQGEKHA